MEEQTMTPNEKLAKMPNVSVKTLYLENYKAYDKYYMNFQENRKKVKPFVCFIGDNGVGKSTALNALQLIFTRLDGYNSVRLNNLLGKSIRHIDSSKKEMHSDKNFLIEAEMASEYGDYTIKIDKNGFIEDHPEEIKQHLFRLCYFARFDQELHQFQLVRKKWDKFKSLFESVTGYEIEEHQDLFSCESESRAEELMAKYVLGFDVKKPNETISYKECSNGERKVIKSFSTMLNLEIQPKIVLIDDIAMHVALGRHLALVDAMTSCYPKSQIFSTTHSYRMTKSLDRKSQIYDLRTIHADPIFTKEPWRFRVIDEIDDSLYKLEGMSSKQAGFLLAEGNKIKSVCYGDINDLYKFQIEISKFLKDVSDLYIIELLA